MFINIPCSNSIALPFNQAYVMRFGRMCLRNGVIRHSVGIFKCDNITGQRRGIT